MIDVPSFVHGNINTKVMAGFALTRAAEYYGFDAGFISATVIADTYETVLRQNTDSILTRDIVINWVALDGDEELMQESQLIVHCGFCDGLTWVEHVIHIVTNDETTYEEVKVIWSKRNRLMTNEIH